MVAVGYQKDLLSVTPVRPVMITSDVSNGFFKFLFINIFFILLVIISVLIIGHDTNTN